MADSFEALKNELEEKKQQDELKAQEEKDNGSAGEKRRRRHHHHHHSSGKKRRHRRHRHRRHGKRRFNKKKFFLFAGIYLLVLILIGVGIIYAMKRTGEREMVADDFNITAPKDVNANVTKNGEYVTYNGVKYQYNKNIINILFLGVDKARSSDESKQIGENHQSDVIMLCSINKEEKKIVLFNVPRDIITDVNVYSPGGAFDRVEKMQIALAYAYGDGKEKSCLNSVESVSRVFYNLPIKTYFSMNLDGITPVNDCIGGVDVRSPETIAEFTEGEKYHLEGSMADDFVRLRSREAADANLKRNERQKVYMNAFLTKFIQKTKSDVSVPIDVYNVSKPYSCTNLNADKITYLATEFIFNRNMDFVYKSVPVDVKTVDNHAENYVKEKEFYEQFLDAFYTKVK